MRHFQRHLLLGEPLLRWAMTSAIKGWVAGGPLSFGDGESLEVDQLGEHLGPVQLVHLLPRARHMKKPQETLKPHPDTSGLRKVT